MGEKVSWARRGLLVLLWLPAIALALAMWSWEHRLMGDRSEGLSPIRLVYVQMDRSERNDFVRQVRRFTDQHHFDLNIRQLTPDPDEIFFQLSRDNILLLGSNNANVRTPEFRFSFAFYRQREKPPPSLAEIDPLMASLKAMLADVPGLVMTKEE
jgi:hypothetical protein